MTPLQLAARIVSRSSVETPADMVLRQTLFRRRGLSPSDATWVSRAVFSYFRWERWLASDRPLESRIEDGLRLAARFAAEPKAFSDDELVRNSVPDWATAHLPTTAALARALQQEPTLWIRSRPEFNEEVSQRLRDLHPGPFADSFRYAGREDLFLDRGFQAGQFEIQDIASQAVGRICAPRAGEVWWDACAGEGGKTLHLSALMGGKSLIWASDRAAWRLDRLRQRAGRAKCLTTAPCTGMVPNILPPRPASTASCSMRPAPVWAPGGAIPIPGGPPPSKTWRNWPRSNGNSS